VISGAAFVDHVGSKEKSTDLQVKVVSVYDGDTFKVDIDSFPEIIGDNMPIRICGIDTPEIRGTNGKIKALALKARDHLHKRLLSSQNVELRNIKRGKYFRIIADVYVEGVDIGNEMISLGYAKPYSGGSRPKW
jgi:endonuclease YncB( thermonuclease family)